MERRTIFFFMVGIREEEEEDAVFKDGDMKSSCCIHSPYESYVDVNKRRGWRGG